MSSQITDKIYIYLFFIIIYIYYIIYILETNGNKKFMVNN